MRRILNLSSLPSRDAASPYYHLGSDVYGRCLRYPVSIPAINCPPFTTAYYLLPEVILTLLNAPRWRTAERSTAISQLPPASRQRDRQKSDEYKWPPAARRVHGISPVTSGDVLLPIYRAGNAREGKARRSNGRFISACFIHNRSAARYPRGVTTVYYCAPGNYDRRHSAGITAVKCPFLSPRALPRKVSKSRQNERLKYKSGFWTLVVGSLYP